jgi:outer membrane protein W
MRRLPFSVSLALIACVFASAPAYAQQSASVYIGGFSPRAEDARVSSDVLVQNRSFLTFDIAHFNAVTVGGEWLVALGDKFDAGLGVGFYQHTEPGEDRFSIFDVTGDPIIANMKLRIVPFAATIRFLPLGHSAAFQPYVGIGAAAYRWRYSETGDFVSSDGFTIVHGNFVGKGSASGPVVLGGARFPIGATSIGGEIRYQSAQGDLPASEGFAGTKIDLGGFNYLLTFNVKF